MQQNPRLLLSRPRDESLEAYKDWILEMYEFLSGKDRAQGDTMTDEQWKASWQRFWEKTRSQTP